MYVWCLIRILGSHKIQYRYSYYTVRLDILDLREERGLVH
jgi:hypothetical protein